MKKTTTNNDLKKAGLKVTLPRISILEILEEAEQHHMSAEDVYKTLLANGNEVGLATVCRVLTQSKYVSTAIALNLVHIGLFQQVSGADYRGSRASCFNAKSNVSHLHFKYY